VLVAAHDNQVRAQPCGRIYDPCRPVAFTDDEIESHTMRQTLSRRLLHARRHRLDPATLPARSIQAAKRNRLLDDGE
jgi:hypothetical protein